MGTCWEIFCVDVFDPTQADMMQEKMETGFSGGMIEQAREAGFNAQRGLALEEKSVHLLEHIV